MLTARLSIVSRCIPCLGGGGNNRTWTYPHPGRDWYQRYPNPPLPDRMTNVRENITFPQLRWWAVITFFASVINIETVTIQHICISGWDGGMIPLHYWDINGWTKTKFAIKSKTLSQHSAKSDRNDVSKFKSCSVIVINTWLLGLNKSSEPFSFFHKKSQNLRVTSHLHQFVHCSSSCRLLSSFYWIHHWWREVS